MAPVGDAVRLVDDDEAEEGQELGQDLVAELRVVQPLGRDEQNVEAAGPEIVEDGVPFGDVGGVEAGCAHPGALRRGDLVTHQRQQRGDDEAGTGASCPKHSGRHEVHGRLAPPGPLDHEDPLLLHDQIADRFELAVPELGLGIRSEFSQDALSLNGEFVGVDGRCSRGGFGHGHSLDVATDAAAQPLIHHLSASSRDRALSAVRVRRPGWRGRRRAHPTG